MKSLEVIRDIEEIKKLEGECRGLSLAFDSFLREPRQLP
jgi:hypothetical protein